VTDELLFLFLFLEFPFRLDNQAIARDCDLEVFFLYAGDVGAYDELVILVDDVDFRKEIKFLVEFIEERPSPGIRLKESSKNSSMLWVNGLIALPVSCSFFGKMLRTLGIRSPP
jgi:hypothetical protein